MDIKKVVSLIIVLIAVALIIWALLRHFNIIRAVCQARAIGTGNLQNGARY
jgi:hypothetical protein